MEVSPCNHAVLSSNGEVWNCNVAVLTCNGEVSTCNVAALSSNVEALTCNVAVLSSNDEGLSCNVAVPSSNDEGLDLQLCGSGFQICSSKPNDRPAGRIRLSSEMLAAKMLRRTGYPPSLRRVDTPREML